MRLLFIGDVVGKEGCEFLASKLSRIKSDYNIDFTVINGENSASGNGITKFSANFLTNIGADVITTGNHAFKRRESLDIFDEYEHIIRPLNYPEGVIGKGICFVDTGNIKIAVVNLMGVVYMEPLENPFFSFYKALSAIDTSNIFVDFHAEATAEKKAMGHYLTGRVTGLFGTHTHVQTSDEIILGGHTAYITDAGMTGAELSVLGVRSDLAIEKQKYHFPVRFAESGEPCFINGVVVEFNEKNGKALNIERIIIR